MVYYVLNSNLFIIYYENYYYRNNKFSFSQDKKLYFYKTLIFSIFQHLNYVYLINYYRNI